MKQKMMYYMSLMMTIFMIFGLSSCSKKEDNVNKKYTITFYVDESEYATIKTAGNETLQLPQEPTDETMNFAGWFFDKDEWINQLTADTYKNTALTKDVDVYAKWAIKTITITYVTNGGSEIPPQTINLGDVMPLPVTNAPSSNLIFAGWHLEEDCSDEPLTFPYYPTEDMTLYADWAETYIEIDGFSLDYYFSETGHQASGYVIASYHRPENAVGLEFPEGYKGIPLVEIPSSFASEFLDQTARDSITSIVIPDGVERIGSNAFSALNNLTSIKLGRGLKSIRSSALSCYKLSDISFGGSLEYVDSNALTNNPWYNAQPDGVVYADNVLIGYKGIAPSTVEVREGTVSIGSGAFYNQRNLTDITLPDSIIAIGRDAFTKTGIKEIKLSKNLEMIGADAFRESKLEKVVFPESFTFDIHTTGWKYGFSKLGGSVFYGCENLTSVTLSNLYEISYEMFRGCTSLTNITLPEGIKISNSFSFADTGLIEITILSKTPVYFPPDVFPETLEKIYVPAGMKALIEQEIANDSSLEWYWSEERMALLVEMDN